MNNTVTSAELQDFTLQACVEWEFWEFLGELDPNQLKSGTTENFMQDRYTFVVLSSLGC